MSTEPEAAERPPISVRRRISLAVGTLLVIVIAFAVASWAYQRGQTSNRLQALIARLDETDPGWKLDELVAARPEPPAGQNSADVALAVAKLVPGNWPYWDADPAYESRRFDGLPTPNLLDPERAKMLADEMRRLAPALAEARRLAAMPYGRHKLDFGPNPWNVLLRDQQDTRRSAALLSYDAWDRAQRGDVAGALLDGRAAINAGRSLGDEPIGISQLIRAACVAVGLGSIERTLALGEASDADLAEVQKLLRLEGQHSTTLVVMRGERASQHATYDGIATGKLSHAEAFGGPGVTPVAAWWLNWFGMPGLNLPRQHLRTLEMLTELAEATKLPADHQLPAEKAVEAKIEALPRGEMFVKLLLPAVLKMNQAFRRKAAQLRALDALLAAERYRLKIGRWPEKLHDIPRELLPPPLPLDPYDGHPVRYRRTADGVVAYCVGEDLRDDGGDVGRVSGRQQKDWGYQLWDVNKRRQPPLPKPKADEGPPGPGQ
ncbi:MAG: hypothetical protein U0797_17005 [Gemmataceae bacterium]